MKVSEIKSNAKEFVKSLDRVALERHLDLMRGISSEIDQIRFRAVEKYMWPRSGRKQKARPPKLTIRTGKLARILRTSGSWSIPRSNDVAKFKGTGEAYTHYISWIRPVKKNGSVEYVARMSIVKADDESVDYRVRHEQYPTKRGNVFPFLRPAINDSDSGFKEIFGSINGKRVRV